MALTALEVKAEIQKFDRQAQAGYLSMFEIKKKGILAKFGRVMQTVPSDGPDEKYPFPRATPQLVEYEEGNVPASQFGAETYVIRNRLFGNSISIGRTFFEDIGRMPAAKQQYLAQIAGLATRGVNYPIKLTADLLLAEGVFAGVKAYDNKDFFAADHAEGSNFYDGTAAFTQDALKGDHKQVLDRFSAMVDPDGEDLLREEAPNELLVLCDPEELTAYAELYRAITHPQVFGSNTAAAAVHNVLAQENKGMVRGIDGLGHAITVIGWSRLRNKGKTFYFDVTDELPGPPAVVHQERLKPELEMLGVGTDTYTIAEQLVWKVRMRGSMGIGNYCKAVMVDKVG